VAGTLAKWFAGQDDLHLAAVDLTALGDTVKWEEARGGAFSRISMARCRSPPCGAWALQWAAEGEPILPNLP
jgi:hypothetical protein